MSAKEPLTSKCHVGGGMAVIQGPDTARRVPVACDTGLPADWTVAESGVAGRTPPAPAHPVNQELLCDPCGDAIQAGGSLRIRRNAAGVWAVVCVEPRHVPLPDGRQGGGAR
jgi:hypothetical protein